MKYIDPRHFFLSKQEQPDVYVSDSLLSFAALSYFHRDMKQNNNFAINLLLIYYRKDTKNISLNVCVI